MLENKFQSLVKREFESTGHMVLNLHGHARQAAGWPDLYVCGPFFRGWLELKCRGWLRPLQVTIVRGLRQRGDEAYALVWEKDRVYLQEWDKTIVKTFPHPFSAKNWS